MLVRLLSRHGHGSWAAIVAEPSLQPALRKATCLPPPPEEGKPLPPLPAPGPPPPEPPPLLPPDVTGMDPAAAEVAMQVFRGQADSQRQRHAKAVAQWKSFHVRSTDPADPLYGLRECDILRQHDFVRARVSALQQSLFAEAFPPDLAPIVDAEQAVRALRPLALEARALASLEGPSDAPETRQLKAELRAFGQLAQQAERGRLESVRALSPRSPLPQLPAAAARSSAPCFDALKPPSALGPQARYWAASNHGVQPHVVAQHGKAYAEVLSALIRDSKQLGATLRGLVPARGASADGAKGGLSDSEDDASDAAVLLAAAAGAQQ